MSRKQQLISGVKWNFAQQVCVQIVNLIVQIVLARLLMPEMFGLIAMVVVFISIGQTLMDSGMTSSLIRAERVDNLDYSTVFLTNMSMSCIIYCVIYFIAPFIAEFYSQPPLTDIVRVLALTFVVKSLVAVHVAKLHKEMNFRLEMLLQLPATVISSLIGVYLAYSGWGVWSLVWLSLSQALVFTLQGWVFIPWRPSLAFSLKKFKEHFTFGFRLTIAGLLDTVFNDSYRVIIGRLFTPSSVGYFHQAETLRLFPVQQISTVLGKVTYPYFVSIESDSSLKSAYRAALKLVFFFSIPVMLGLGLIAEEGFRLVLGEKWLPAVPYFQVLILASIVRPASAYNLNILKVKGRSDLLLKAEVIKKVLGIALIVAGLPFGVMGLVVSLTSYSIISFFINMYYSGSLISYSVFEQIKDVFLLLLNGACTFCLLYLLKLNTEGYINNDFWLVALFFISFCLIFVCFSLFIDKDLLKIAKGILNLNKRKLNVK